MAAIGLTLSQVLELPVFDGMASISIGLILGFTAVLLALRTKSLLIGESADPALVEDVRKRASELEAVVAVNEVLTLHMGPNFVLLNVSVDLKDSLPAGKIEEAIDLLTREIRETHPDIKRVFIEAESRKTHALRSP
jgi:divalent metal cation (Fe/Co/Zn/Cd) transporter